jgi:hypothetical protein
VAVVMNCDHVYVCPYYSVLEYMLKILFSLFGLLIPLFLIVAVDTSEFIFHELRMLLKVHSGQEYIL